MILANWRGFSGGQRDMYNEVLKYGSFIVDALVKFEQPIFVYIPPFGELRGGSWVVIDPTINPAAMEMYADAESRGGVLEPEGIVGIKYRKDKQLETMARLDPKYADLKKRMAAATAAAAAASKGGGAAAATSKTAASEEMDELKRQIAAREYELLPVYAQIALQFADLHDRAGRMKAKGVIRGVLEWRNARRFFYWRVRRRLNEEYLLRRLAGLASGVSHHHHGGGDNNNSKAAHHHQHASHARDRHLQLLEAWSGIPEFQRADREVALWYEENKATISTKMEALRAETVAAEMRELIRSSKGENAAWKGVRDMLRVMPVEEREKVLGFLAE